MAPDTDTDINEDEVNEFIEELDIDDDDDDDFDDDEDIVDEEDDEEFSVKGASSKGSFEIEFSDVPKINRPAPPGRTAFAWEKALDVVRENRGQSARVLTFEDDGVSNPKARAQAKAQQIRNRLFEKVPDEHWDIKSRERDGVWGIYVIYHGKLTPEQQTNRDAKRAERAARIMKGRAKNAAKREAEVETSPNPETVDEDA